MVVLLDVIVFLPRKSRKYTFRVCNVAFLVTQTNVYNLALPKSEGGETEKTFAGIKL